MGRAFPTLDNTTFKIFGLRACPVIVTNEHADAVIIESANARAEAISRAVLTELGGACCSVLYPMSGRDAKRTLIPRTVSLALNIGRAILAARAAGADPLDALIRELRRFDPAMVARVLFEGKVTDVCRTIAGGFNTGAGTLRGLGAFRGDAGFVFQNEFLTISVGGKTLAIVPDLICFLDSETTDPITCETLRYGQRVRVLGISSAPVLRTPAGIAACGPAAFGLTEPFVSLAVA